MSKAFYRKYRSKSLEEVVGQSHITDILSRTIKEGKVAHAYLFTGPRGVGKTSVARILAHEINKLPYEGDESHLDIIEIDAASNNGVEDIRELREKVQLAPVSASKKVYIIDEVHMLSKAAFNALLKTLEEPPEHVVFILATTDADKLPDTIISRTQRFSFRTISKKEVAEHLGKIAEQEGFSADKEALEVIATHGEGSFRDSISLLDQLHSAADQNGVTKELVENFLGIPPLEAVKGLIEAYESSDLPRIISLLEEAERSGAQPGVVATELIRTIRSLLATRPHLIGLLDKLLDVANSSRPDIKLLTVLASGTQPKATPEPAAPLKQKTAALTAPTPAVTVELPSEIKPEAKKSSSVKTPKQDTSTKEPTDFDWAKVLEHVKANHIAMFSMLSKCSASLEGETLTIYSGNMFYKKKLDDVRYRTNLISTLSTLGMGELVVETVASAPPPKDTTAATVAALMGGGEEYNIEETETA